MLNGPPAKRPGWWWSTAKLSPKHSRIPSIDHKFFVEKINCKGIRHGLCEPSNPTYVPVVNLSRCQRLSDFVLKLVNWSFLSSNHCFDNWTILYIRLLSDFQRRPPINDDERAGTRDFVSAGWLESWDSMDVSFCRRWFLFYKEMAQDINVFDPFLS